ncbi:MAG: response regulator transcription factor [Xenococcaceae cyanobacterium MO_188.B29]|nr:response regulator transcription factor [Xenococcaceae cyanobacterium MO_188.B29]
MSDYILVVEDNDDISLLLKLVLESAGYQVETVNNGKDALKQVETVQPQLMLVDIMMPEMNGLQVAHNVKEKLDHQNLPILLVSAVDRLKDEQLQNSQAEDIIYKPFDIDYLLSKVDSLTSNY